MRRPCRRMPERTQGEGRLDAQETPQGASLRGHKRDLGWRQPCHWDTHTSRNLPCSSAGRGKLFLHQSDKVYSSQFPLFSFFGTPGSSHPPASASPRAVASGSTSPALAFSFPALSLPICPRCPVQVQAGALSQGLPGAAGLRISSAGARRDPLPGS